MGEEEKEGEGGIWKNDDDCPLLSDTYKGEEVKGVEAEEEGNADYGGMMQPSQQAVVSVSKICSPLNRFQWGED